MLRQDFGIDLSAFAEALPQDDHGINVKQVWDTVRARIRDVPGFEVVEDVVLSTFSFAKYLMWKDLTDRTDTLKSSPFVRHVIDTPRDLYKCGASFLDPWEVDSAIAPSEADRGEICVRSWTMQPSRSREGRRFWRRRRG